MNLCYLWHSWILLAYWTAVGCTAALVQNCTYHNILKAERTMATDYKKWNSFVDISDEDETELKAVREIRTTYFFASTEKSVMEELLAMRESFLVENPQIESNRLDPLLDYINSNDQNSVCYISDEHLTTDDFRFDPPDLYPQLEINPLLIDYTSRTMCKSNVFKVEHVIDIDYFLGAYKLCEPKPDRNAVRILANRPSNVVKAASWVDDLKKHDAQFNTLAGAYMTINMSSVAETLREVYNHVGLQFLSLLIAQIKKWLKIELSFNEQTKDVEMYVNHDLECYLRELMLFATVPVFEIRTVPCCGKKQFMQSIDEVTIQTFRSCKRRQQKAVDAIRYKTLNLFRTFWEFRLGPKETVPAMNITKEMYLANQEAVEYQELLTEVRQLLADQKKKP